MNAIRDGHAERKTMKMCVGNFNLNVVDTGTGEPALLLLHYWGGSARTWRRVTEVLQCSYRCIAYDQRGWGSSDAPTDGYELKDLAQDAFALIAALGLQRYVLIGHSMGGKVAQLLASYRPAGLEALILIAPASPLPQHIPEEAREAQKHAYDNRQTALGAIGFLTASHPDDEALEQLVQDSLAGSPAAKRGWPTSAAYEDISGEVSKIAVPTLILVGDRDPQDPEEQQRREVLPLIDNATLKVVPNCGHLIPVDQPVALAEEVVSFLSTHENSGS
jgi:pimeloyl-ACP methyl ester carboxylesterase